MSNSAFADLAPSMRIIYAYHVNYQKALIILKSGKQMTRAVSFKSTSRKPFGCASNIAFLKQ
jgi:uncharacterized protein YrrD